MLLLLDIYLFVFGLCGRGRGSQSLVLWAPCSQYCIVNASVRARVCNASSTQKLKVQGSGDHLQQLSKCKSSWWEIDPLQEISKMTSLFFCPKFTTNQYDNIIPGNEIQVGYIFKKKNYSMAVLVFSDSVFSLRSGSWGRGEWGGEKELQANKQGSKQWSWWKMSLKGDSHGRKLPAIVAFKQPTYFNKGSMWLNVWDYLLRFLLPTLSQAGRTSLITCFKLVSTGQVWTAFA